MKKKFRRIVAETVCSGIQLALAPIGIPAYLGSALAVTKELHDNDWESKEGLDPKMLYYKRTEWYPSRLIGQAILGEKPKY